jgi:hypothetical protein
MFKGKLYFTFNILKPKAHVNDMFFTWTSPSESFNPLKPSGNYK